MGYQFRGFLTANTEAAQAAIAQWPFCEMKAVQEQFQGFIIRCPNTDDLHPTEGEEALGLIYTQIDMLKLGLPDFSKQFPQTLFVYVEIDCFGGTCTNEGLHVMNGEIIAEFEGGPDETDLADILAPLNIKLDENRYFKPFTRNYFERDKFQAWNYKP